MIQRSSWVTSRVLRLPDGAGARARADRWARVLDDFSWIHKYDVQRVVVGKVQRASRATTA